MCFIRGCTKKGTYSTLDKAYCERHFVTAIEKRVRKDLRVHKKISTKKTYTILDTRTKEKAIATRMLASIFGEHLHVKKTKKITKNTIIPTNLDREINKKLAFFLEKKKVKPQQGILILDNVTDDEQMVLAKIWKIPGKPEPKNPLVMAIEKKHPGTVFALKKSLDQVIPHG
jgi:uncharacterized protein (UPF0147 family)